MDTDLKKYEIAYLVSENVLEDDVVRVVGIVTKTVSDAGGAIDRIEEPLKRKLAYPINKERNAYFGYTTFQISPSSVNDLNKKLSSEKEVIRYLVTEADSRKSALPPSRPLWQPVREPQEMHAERPRAKPETREPSPEEREATIKDIDKRLEEILGA